MRQQSLLKVRCCTSFELLRLSLRENCRLSPHKMIHPSLNSNVDFIRLFRGLDETARATLVTSGAADTCRTVIIIASLLIKQETKVKLLCLQHSNQFYRRLLTKLNVLRLCNLSLFEEIDEFDEEIRKDDAHETSLYLVDNMALFSAIGIRTSDLYLRVIDWLKRVEGIGLIIGWQTSMDTHLTVSRLSRCFDICVLIKPIEYFIRKSTLICRVDVSSRKSKVRQIYGVIAKGNRIQFELHELVIQAKTDI
ncbi:hypothetical protein ACOME3_003178 [Neoechinorhynchus agilis]